MPAGSRFLAALLLAVLLAPFASAADWIHWRGPDQTGFSRDTQSEIHDFVLFWLFIKCRRPGRQFLVFVEIHTLIIR